MDAQRKITVAGVISEGIGLGIKNAISMLGATIILAAYNLDSLFKCRYYNRHDNHSY